MLYAGANPLARARRLAAATVLSTALAITLQAAPALAGPALAGQWRFDEGAGQVAVDDGPLGLHGVLGAGPQADGEDPSRVAGMLGGALRFGGGTYVHVPNDQRLDQPRLTVETIARADGSPGAYRYLVANSSRGCFSGAYGLYTAANGGLAFYVFDGDRYFVSASARPEDVWDGSWRRLTGTFDGVHVRVFVDGVEIGTSLRTPAGTAIEFESMPEGTFFGSYVGACRLAFAGDLDSVRILSGASAPAEVAAQAGVQQGAAAAATAAAGATARVVPAQPPKATCSVRASHRQIRARRRVAVTVRAAGPNGPLRRVRLAVRRAGARKILAVARTNAKGSVTVRLRVGRGGRVRIGVVGRASCTPAFIKVT